MVKYTTEGGKMRVVDTVSKLIYVFDENDELAKSVVELIITGLYLLENSGKTPLELQHLVRMGRIRILEG